MGTVALASSVRNCSWLGASNRGRRLFLAEPPFGAFSPNDFHVERHVTRLAGRDTGDEPPGVGPREAMIAVNERHVWLESHLPEHFSLLPETRLVAFERFPAVAGRVHVIEAVWDGDTTHGRFLTLLAPSRSHPRYTETELTLVTQRDAGRRERMEFTTELQRDLATSVGAELHPPSWPPDDLAPRWWDSNEAR